MSNKLFLIVIFIFLAAGGVIGFAVSQWIAPSVKVINGETKTLVVEKKVPVKVTEIKYIKLPAPDSAAGISPVPENRKHDISYAKSFSSFTDSLSGMKDSVNYKVVHNARMDKDSVRSSWKMEIDNLVKEQVKEITNIEIKDRIVEKPFYSDGWFWAALIAVPLLFLSLLR